VFGSSYNKEIAHNLPFVSHYLGILHDEYSLIMMYKFMDVLGMPSLAENFPNTILESLACNTPVIGFNTGGISEMVNTNTGYLAKYGNSIDLAKGISSLLKEGKDNVNNFINPFLSNTILEEHKKLWIND
jgi:glycosyltransferase involved in cell wall biosynthesis